MYCGGKIFIILIAALTFAVANANYCDKRLCPHGKKHIACNNTGAFAPNCINPQIIQITPQYRKQILREHNKYRNKIAKGFDRLPPAARMATVVWNKALAKMAELNVKQCSYKKDLCHNTVQFKNSGQNIADNVWSQKTVSVAELISNATKGWFDEYTGILSSPGDPYLQFLTMVQDKCTHIGCAIIRHEKYSSTYQLMACNYSTLVITNAPVYKAGVPASQCKTGTNPKFKYLCSVREKYST